MKWLEYFKTSESNRDIIANEIFERNIQYISIASFFAVPINLFHIILFYLNLDVNKYIEYIWRLGVIYSHLFLLIFFTFIGIIFNYYKYRKKPSPLFIQFSFFLVFLVLIASGVSLAVIDQYVTSAITPFLVMCILIPMTLLIRPLLSLSLYIVSYVLFYTLLPLTQTNPDILLSNRVNGATFIGIGMFLSLAMWRNSMRRFKQERIIKHQKSNLEKSYSNLLKTADSLKIANASKDKFFSIIAHDLRSPFNAILGFSDLLQTEYREGSIENFPEYIQLISTSARQAQLLLENLLLWAKSQTGVLVYKPSEFIINDLIESIFDLLRSNAINKNISLTLDSDDSYIVNLDKQMIDTVFRNLILNSIKYTKDGGQVKVSIQKEHDSIKIIVSDTGVGIKPEMLGNLFKINHAVSTQGTKGEMGSGLGLILCKEFIELNKGSIEVESEPGKGSRFTVKFPHR